MSEVKVDKISPKTGTSMTVGDSGDTFTVPSGATLTVAGALNVTGTTSLADGTVAVAELDIDGATDIGAGIADADLFVVDDGAGGTNRKTAASRLKTYILADNSIDSDMYVDGSIDTAHIANDQITAALMADNSIDSDMYVDGSIDLAHMSSESVDEDNLHISNAGSNGQFLSKQSGNSGGLTWASASADADNYFASSGLSSKDLGVGLHLKISDTGASVNSGSDALVLEDNGGDMGMSILSSTSGQGRIFFGDSGGNDRGQVAYDHGDDSMRLYTAGAERMRITSGGQMHLGDTSGSGVIKAKNTGNATYAINAVGNSTETVGAFFNNSTSGTHRIVDFLDGQSQLGGSVNINCSANSCSFETSSDYRLKENVVDLTGAITRVKDLKPKRFNFIADETNTLRDGFLAHEIQAVVPEAASGTKDETETKTNVVVNSVGAVLGDGITEAEWTAGKADEILYVAEDQEVIDGLKNVGDVKTEATYPSDSTWHASKEFIRPQGVDYGLVTPLLVAALKEAVTEIDALKARVTTLEG